MYSDWSVELGADAAVLSVPWHDATGQLAYINLRTHPEQISLVPEAVQHPMLAQALLALNEPRSGITTAKCDVWPLDADDVAACADLLDLLHKPDHPHFGYGSYIDILFREEAIFTSYDEHMQILPAITRAAGALDLPEATMELVLRLCTLGDGSALTGYATSVYTYGVGATAELAYRNWSEALAAVTGLLLRVS
ncbi:MAG: hypothetical protein ACYC46_01635 [Acidobacteriaceae bacterium]